MLFSFQDTISSCTSLGQFTEADQSTNTDTQCMRSKYHTNTGSTRSSRKLRTKPAYEVVNDQENRNDETDVQANMNVKTSQLGMNTEARWFGSKT